MKARLHIDIETYSPVDLAKCGVHEYCAHEDFEILIIAYKYDTNVASFTGRCDPPRGDNYWLIDKLKDPLVEKHAYNAPFEIACLESFYGIDLDRSQWHCTMVKAATHGLPSSLDKASTELQLGDSAKDKEGKALIKLFSVPQKPTKKNNFVTRATAETHPLEWARFAYYCEQDVEAESAVYDRLAKREVIPFEREIWLLDQKINNRGVLIDRAFAEAVIDINSEVVEQLTDEIAELTGLDNPASGKQFAEWLNDNTDVEATTMRKDDVQAYAKQLGMSDEAASRAIEIYPKLKRSSIAKYDAMLRSAGSDDRARGLFQFAGAGRTGRWAGRRVQPQNMPRIHLNNIDTLREIVKRRDTESLNLLFDDVTSVLSQLIRTAIIADEGYKLVVCDFSAIEARVVAWLARCEWRLEVFRTHGKIYEASASAMFKVPISAVTKDSDYRMRAKVAELALGYQGSVGALAKMGAEAMGMTDADMQSTVDIWRAANPEIVQMWYTIQNLSIQALRNPGSDFYYFDILTFAADSEFLKITLPSGRGIYYYKAQLTINKFGRESVRYRGQIAESGTWGWVDTYGGKFVENIAQALARDVMAEAMVAMDKYGLDILLHVHDEIGVQALDSDATETLETMRRIMSHTPNWAKGLPLAAEGFISDFYKKD